MEAIFLRISREYDSRNATYARRLKIVVIALGVILAGSLVTAGRSMRSASSNFLMVSSAFRGLPGGFLGVNESPSRSILAKRLTEERLTSKRLAASFSGMPRLRASTILRLRSSE